MCLDLSPNRSESFIAEEDIVCYKFLQKDNNGMMVTFYQRCPVKKGKEYTSPLRKKQSIFWDDVYAVEEGLHSFANMEGLVEFITDWKLRSKVYVAKCIIPKGATYYDGYFSEDWHKSYASDRLIYVKILKYRKNVFSS